MEKIFDVMDCNDAFKTRLAVYKFEGDALAWWKAYKQAKGGDVWVLTLTWAAFKELFFLQFFPRAEQERLKREYHSIRQRASENSTEYMQRFLRLAGFLGQAAGTAEEQAKNFRWGLHKSILDHVMCIQFTDVAQVADAARNLEILRDRDDYDRSERSDKRNSGAGATKEQRVVGNTQESVIVAIGTCFKWGQAGHLRGTQEENTGASSSGHVTDARRIRTCLCTYHDQGRQYFSTPLLRLTIIPSWLSFGDIFILLNLFIYVRLFQFSGRISEETSKEYAIRDVEFNIELIPEFYRQSVSPWGSPVTVVKKKDCCEVEKSRTFQSAFRTRYGHYDFLLCLLVSRMLSVFMDLMNRSFSEFLGQVRQRRSLMIFVVLSKSKEEHEEHLRTVLQILRQEKLYAKFFKCEFWLSKVAFLGSHCVLAEGIPMRIRRRLRLSPNGQDRRGFQIYSDASKKGLGCVLMQHGKVIAYASRQLKPYEVNYPTMIWCLRRQDNVRVSCLSEATEFRVDDDGFLWQGTKYALPEDPTLREALMSEAHSSPIFDATSGLLQPLEIPVWKWDEISMDFVTGLPRTQRKHDAIWVVVDRLTKSAHFLPIRKDYPIEIHVSRLVSGKGLQKAWGTRLKFSTAFHPETDGQSERTIQTLEDMLRSCALEWAGNWDDYICLVEFAYNNSWHASIKCAPFEMLYGRKCRAPICWDQVGERILEGPEMIEVTNEKVAVAREKLKEARLRQKSYADRNRRAGKLSPRFIGPFEILDRVGEVSYRLALPPQLSHVHNVFHVSLLRGQSHEEQKTIPFVLNFLEESSEAEATGRDRGVFIRLFFFPHCLPYLIALSRSSFHLLIHLFPLLLDIRYLEGDWA
ncbi:putative nucleotidyltransferase, ribonuclease H [Tanacetum coccineum]|uniref:Nucleotidyltransferase, ribonuclease H n=1 Tax=Tanacetum coccineum TaxID=301880 RepID=A0ABQ5CMR8_9ASTR